MFNNEGKGVVKRSLTLSLDTNAYSDRDVLADRQELVAAVATRGGTGRIIAVGVQDDDDQGQDLSLYILGADVSIGTENAAISITDANAAYLQAVIPVTQWHDNIGSQFAYHSGLDVPIRGEDSTSVWVAAVSDGTGTYTASGLKLTIWIEQE